MGRRAGRPGLYIEMGGRPNRAQGNTLHGLSFCESRPVQLAATGTSPVHRLVRAEATVSCRGRGRSALDQLRTYGNANFFADLILAPSRV
jgi:hypothetical protein